MSYKFGGYSTDTGEAIDAITGERRKMDYEAWRRGEDPPEPKKRVKRGRRLPNSGIFKKDEPRPDEMAAGLIHESGTGGIAALAREPDISEHIDHEAVAEAEIEADRDHCGYVEDEPVAEFSEVDETETELDMYKRFYAESVRSNMEAEQRVTELETEIGTIVHRAVIGENQRDFLSRQVDSLVQRLAASHVAAGLIDMAAAQGFVQKEILPINQVLAQIAAQPQGE